MRRASALLLLAAFTAGSAASAQASLPGPVLVAAGQGDREPHLEQGKGPLWGVQLDWSKDSAAVYARRLGAKPLLLETGAFYSPASGGPLKRTSKVRG